MSLTPRVFRGVALPVDPAARRPVTRADIVLSGVEHGGSSYELRVFVDNEDADATTELSTATGYAGSIYVYGYGSMPEAAGPAAKPEPGDPAGPAGDPAPPDPIAPRTRYVVATDALRAAAGRGATTTVTVVPVGVEPGGPGASVQWIEVSVLVRD